MYRRLILKALRVSARTLRQMRSSSAWINRARADADSTLDRSVDAEKLFINPAVQRLLTELTGMDLEGKVFKERRTEIQQRSHFALMTEERLAETMEKMKAEAQRFLNFVPLKEPRSEEVTILSEDSEIAGFDNSKFVFTDITFDATDQDRTVVVREVDGTLRTATPEEHDRMNRTYYEKPNRPVFPPPVFEDPYLQDALDRKEHEFVLDWACWFFEPDDPSYIKLVQRVFDRVLEKGDFDVLHSTRHFGTMVFYFALNGNIPPLLNYFGARGRLHDCANLVRLQKTLHPDWRFVINTSDSDLKIVTDFVKQNVRHRDQLKDLNAFLKDGTVIPSTSRSEGPEQSDSDAREKATVDASSVREKSGPLGELSEEYDVKVIKSEGESEPDTHKHSTRKERRGRFQSRHMRKDSPKKDN